MTVGDFVSKLVGDNEIVVFSKPSCAKCVEIKNELKDANRQYLEVDVPSMEDEYDIDGVLVVEELKNLTRSKQYPFCFKNGKYIEVDELKKKLIVFDGKDLDI